MRRTIVTTEDGSHTIRVDELDEHYHNTHGAIEESEYVFLKHGYHQAGTWLNPFNILEVGFGTGLNALLTFRENLKEKRKVNYIAIEPYPLTKEEKEALNYHDLIEVPDSKKVFNSLHKDTSSPYFIGEQFIILHLKNKLEDVKLKPESLNLVYFDAFAPSVQPEIWEKDVFKKLYEALENNGVLVTYSASGNVKRALHETGFQLEHPQGPPGKREITVARKTMSWQQIMS